MYITKPNLRWFDRYLAAERAEFEGIEEAAVTDVAGVGDAFPRPRLRPLVQEHHLGAVDYVRLHRADIQILLYFRDSDNIVIWRPPYLIIIKPHFSVPQQFKNNKKNKSNQNDKQTWIARWSLWKAKQSEQRGPFIQSKQYILHSLLWESAWDLQWTKNCSFNNGFNHGGHLLFSSSGP